MSGLVKITEKILSDAKAEAADKIKSAEAEAEKIKAENADLTKTLNTECEKKLARLVSSEAERLEASKALRERDALAEAERDTVSEIIVEAKDRLFTLPDKEYFGFLAELFQNTCGGDKGELLLTEKDRCRIDTAFLKRLGDGIVLSNDFAPSAGFILKCGKTEKNCTFDAIFKSYENQLFDIAISCLKR